MIEGTEMKVCEGCASFGKILGRALSKDEIKQDMTNRLKVLEKKKEEKAETIHIVVPDYSNRIKAGREKLGLTQKEFALKLSERESIIHQLESGHMKPSIELAQKLEKFLKIKLVDEFKDEAEGKSSSKKRASDAFTLGDFIKTK
jgi:putative transcription factor